MMPGSLLNVNMNELIPSLYLGNLVDAKSKAIRLEHGITHVLTLCPNLTRLDTGLPASHHLIISVDDNSEGDLLVHFAATYEFVEDVLESQGKVLIHCANGLSRSPTVVAAYLIRKRGLTASGAISFVRKARPNVQPNPTFLKQLDIYECSYDSSLSNKAYSTISQNPKGSHHRRPFSISSLLGRETLIAFAGKIYMREPFPDLKDTENLLQQIHVTHVLGSDKLYCPPTIAFQHVELSLKSFMEGASFIHKAVRAGGVVLIYDPEQSLAWTLLCTYLVTSLNLNTVEARSVLDTAKEVRIPRA